MTEGVLLMSRDLNELHAIRPEDSVIFSVHHKFNPLKDFYLARCHGEMSCDVQEVNSVDSLDSILTEAELALEEESLVIRDLTRTMELMTLATESELWSVLQLDGETHAAEVKAQVDIQDPKIMHETTNTAKSSHKVDGTKLSYRDVLARAVQEKAPEAVSSLELLHSRPKWEPKFVLEKTSYLRLDRKYGAQPSIVDEDEGMI